MPLRAVLALLCAGFCLQAQDPEQQARARSAWVIGNSQYANLPPLPAAEQEALLMADALTRAGFQVRISMNVDNEAFESFLTTNENSFASSLRPTDAVVVYFSGYAIQGIDDNYLLPVDFEPQGEGELQDRAYHLSRIQEEVEFAAPEGPKAFVIEGARQIDVPILGSAGRGLREPNLTFSNETLFAFSADLGQTYAGTDEVGAFTKALAARIAEPGSQFVDVFTNTQIDVGQETNAAQFPYVRAKVITRDFYFHDPPPKQEPEVITKVIEVPVDQPTGPQPGDAEINSLDRQQYVYIPAGSFLMGCVTGDQYCLEKGDYKNELPRHEVEISKNFWMGQTEVTRGAYESYIGRWNEQRDGGKELKMPSKPNWDVASDQPVVNVTWEEANAFCVWVGGRLPTEAEWEYAARAGTDRIYPFADQDVDSEESLKRVREKANFYGKTGNDQAELVASVRHFDPNDFGLYDMAGNVWEWVNDFYGEDYYMSSPKVDPKGPTSGKEHVARGGSFDSRADEHLRISLREHWSKSGNVLGFRCAMDDTPETRRRLGIPEPPPPAGQESGQPQGRPQASQN